MRNRTVDIGPIARAFQVAAMVVILLGVLAILVHSVINGRASSSYMAADDVPVVTVP